jgi:hypothetical protein
MEAIEKVVEAALVLYATMYKQQEEVDQLLDKVEKKIALTEEQKQTYATEQQKEIDQQKQVLLEAVNTFIGKK